MLTYSDRYILREITLPFLMGLLAYTFVLLMSQLLLFSELFIAKGVSLGATLKLLVFLIPAALSFTIPMSVLMGILAGLSRMSSDAEIIAIKTLGISYVRLLRPLLLFAFVGWMATSVLALYLAPTFNFKWVQLLTSAVLNRVELQFNPREFNETVAGMTLFFQDVNKDRNWKNLFIFFYDVPEETRILMAGQGRLHVYADAKRAVLELRDVTQHTSSLKEPEDYGIMSSAHIEQEIDAASLFATYAAVKQVREKNIEELGRGLTDIETKRPILERDRKDVERRRLLKRDPQLAESAAALADLDRDRRSILIEIYKKFALPFVCWIFVFIGLPLGSSTRKGGRTSGFTISIAIILVYYIFITAGEQMAMDGRTTPFLGMWAGNIVFAVLGAWLFYRALREESAIPSFVRRLAEPLIAPQARAVRKFRLRRLSLPFPNILDRYVIRRYLLLWTMIFASFIAISVIVTFFDRIGNLYEHHKPLSMLLDYVWFRIPEFAHYGLPVASLMGAVLSLGLFSKSNEITAMKASGISVYRIVLPLILLAVVVGGVSFRLQEKILPGSDKKAAAAWNKINDVPPTSFGLEKRRLVSNKAGTRIFHYNYFDQGKSTFYRFSIIDLDPESWKIVRRTYAEKAVLSEHTLHLEDGWFREFSNDLQAKFEKRPSVDVPLPEGKSLFLREGKAPSQMTYGELRSLIREVKDMGADTARLRVDLRSKISFPFVALIMSLVGIPFAFSMGKRGALVGIGISLALSIVYWVAIGVFKSLGYVHILNPFFAAWGPNLIFGLAGLYFLFRLRT